MSKKVVYVAVKKSEADYLTLKQAKKDEILPQLNVKGEQKKVCINVVDVRNKTPNQIVDLLINHKTSHLVFEPCAKEIVAGIIQSLQKKMKDKMPLMLAVKNTEINHSMVRSVTEENFIALLSAQYKK